MKDQNGFGMVYVGLIERTFKENFNKNSFSQENKRYANYMILSRKAWGYKEENGTE